MKKAVTTGPVEEIFLEELGEIVSDRLPPVVPKTNRPPQAKAEPGEPVLFEEVTSSHQEGSLEALKESFKALGLSESAAASAAQGHKTDGESGLAERSFLDDQEIFPGYEHKPELEYEDDLYFRRSRSMSPYDHEDYQEDGPEEEEEDDVWTQYANILSQYRDATAAARRARDERPDPFAMNLARSFAALGMSESAAEQAARGRDLIGTANGPEEILTECFKAIGLNESQARQAARGRGGRLFLRKVKQGIKVSAAAVAEEARHWDQTKNAAQELVESITKKQEGE